MDDERQAGGFSDDAGEASPDWRITLNDSINVIPADDWDRCAGPANPLQSHALLKAMEDSGSAIADTGWMPRHLTLTDADGRIHGVMPLYIKSHSYGEYVFDHSWANAWQRAGGQYYPKAQSAIPFSPVPGQRLLIDSPDPDAAFIALAHGAIEATDAMNLSSLHITFLSGGETEGLNRQDPRWINRKGVQFHWRNQGFDHFDDFLGLMAARKRKTIRRERREMQGLRFHHLTGDDLTPAHWDRFYQFYLATIEKKWGGAYLTREFFDIISQTMADRVLLVMAEDEGEMIAGALNFIGTDTLYGRNWGCLDDRPFLHFETCYYQAIDFAIARGLTTVEAGAQGLHKVQRGYAPVPTYSSHYIPHEEFARVIADFTRREALQVDREIKELDGWSPYRKDASGDHQP
ncbi:MAG: N-acetyltransferase [Alphaproteobacteria bacterium]|nr:N-acetyltransferase [Alphaproteobacteria bacterium]